MSHPSLADYDSAEYRDWKIEDAVLELLDLSDQIEDDFHQRVIRRISGGLSKILPE